MKLGLAGLCYVCLVYFRSKVSLRDSSIARIQIQRIFVFMFSCLHSFYTLDGSTIQKWSDLCSSYSTLNIAAGTRHHPAGGLVNYSAICNRNAH